MISNTIHQGMRVGAQLLKGDVSARSSAKKQESASYADAYQTGMALLKIFELAFSGPIVGPLVRPLLKGIASSLPSPVDDLVDVRYYQDGSLDRATLARPRRVNGILFPTGTVLAFHGERRNKLECVYPPVSMTIKRCRAEADKAIFFHPNGSVKEFSLERPSYIGGIVCREYVSFHPDGSLAGTSLYYRRRFGNLILPAGTWIKLDRAGKLAEAHFASTTTVGGISLSRDDPVMLYPSGRVKQGTLNGNQRFGGIDCEGGQSIRFHADGKLAAINLARKTVVQGIPCDRTRYWGNKKKTYDVLFHPNGKIKRAMLSKNQTIDGIACEHRWGNTVEFYPNGHLKSGALAEGMFIGDVFGAKGVEFSLFDDGRLKWLDVNKEQGVGGVRVKEGTRVHFYHSGPLKQFVPAQDVMIRGVVCQAGVTVRLNKDGSIYAAMLAADLAVKGGTLPRGTYIWCDDSGKPEYARFTKHAIVGGRFFQKGMEVDLKTMKIIQDDKRCGK